MAVKLNPEQTRDIQAEIDAAPDWGGAVVEQAICYKGPVPGTFLAGDDEWKLAEALRQEWREAAAGTPDRPVVLSTQVEDGTLGDLVRWNGALWMLAGIVNDEMWLAPLAGVLRRPLLVQPEDGVLDGRITHRAPNNG